ncbi:Ribosomal RNA small subunit methyltransferase G [Desulfovibrio sp. X2]|uniref:16S rRNA (guanine(527)-N(7))-methyltransferase RsmG n=1 Tax=Desulfovibrio sp. X2 TaxID=941449 RepID=UPI000358A85E|nr:RsmG family class I SAM-dependent methyltransferase [Desulfovibrio sp. X2]EPR37517.1 Ribosomal RNA small subunit methyltransferase G [Desulfovibrio sp. X2]
MARKQPKPASGVQQIAPSAAETAAAMRALGREPSGGEAAGLALYLGLLMQWSARMNLVGARDWRRALSELAADSWHLADFLAGHPLLPANPLCLDLGAGAGLPGIPLRLFWQEGEYHMVEPREKRALFLGVALARLSLPRTHVERCRAEELPEGLRGADLVVSRAFMPWREYLEVARTLLAPGGVCVVMAGGPPPDGPVQGWRASECAAYAVEAGEGRQERYFWSFTPEAISR